MLSSYIIIRIRIRIRIIISIIVSRISLLLLYSSHINCYLILTVFLSPSPVPSYLYLIGQANCLTCQWPDLGIFENTTRALEIPASFDPDETIRFSTGIESRVEGSYVKPARFWTPSTVTFVEDLVPIIHFRVSTSIVLFVCYTSMNLFLLIIDP